MRVVIKITAEGKVEPHGINNEVYTTGREAKLISHETPLPLPQKANRYLR